MMTIAPDTIQPDTAFTKRAIFGLPSHLGPMRTNRFLLALGLLGLAAAPGLLGEVTRGALEDAYIGVSVFVAATLMLFYGAENYSALIWGRFLKTPA